MTWVVVVLSTALLAAGPEGPQKNELNSAQHATVQEHTATAPTAPHHSKVKAHWGGLPMQYQQMPLLHPTNPSTPLSTPSTSQVASTQMWSPETEIRTVAAPWDNVEHSQDNSATTPKAEAVASSTEASVTVTPIDVTPEHTTEARPEHSGTLMSDSQQSETATTVPSSAARPEIGSEAATESEGSVSSVTPSKSEVEHRKVSSGALEATDSKQSTHSTQSVPGRAVSLVNSETEALSSANTTNTTQSPANSDASVPIPQQLKRIRQLSDQLDALQRRVDSKLLELRQAKAAVEANTTRSFEEGWRQGYQAGFNVAFSTASTDYKQIYKFPSGTGHDMSKPKVFGGLPPLPSTKLPSAALPPISTLAQLSYQQWMAQQATEQ